MVTELGIHSPCVYYIGVLASKSAADDGEELAPSRVINLGSERYSISTRGSSDSKAKLSLG